MPTVAPLRGAEEAGAVERDGKGHANLVLLCFLVSFILYYGIFLFSDSILYLLLRVFSLSF